MFPKFIQVGLYSRGREEVCAYIRDVNWFTYFGDVFSGGGGGGAYIRGAY